MQHKKAFMLVTRLFLVVYVFSCFLTSVDVVAAEKPGDDDRGFSAVLYDSGNGLPASEANAVAQTSIGFIWIGGYDGLVRYDGIEFKHFDPTSGISSVNCLYVDSQDRLWIGTNDSGLAVEENAQFKFWGRDDGLISLSVRALCEDADGNILIATTEGLAYIDPDGKLQTLDDPRLKEKYVRRLMKDANGIIYGCTMDGCIFAIEQLTLISFYDKQDMGIGDIFCITPDTKEKGKVYLGMGNSEIISVNMLAGMEDPEVLSVDPLEHINDIYLASDHKIWVCASNGLGYFDETGNFVELTNYPMNNSIISVTEDHEGNLWFASSRQGVMKVVRSPFVDITGISGLDRVVANTTCVYQGDLYIGTDAGLQLLDKDYKQKENVLTQLLDGVRLRSIKADSAGNLWLCTYTGDYGLICYHGDGTYQIFNKESGLVSNKIRTVSELSDGSIAVAASGGVNLIKDGRVTAAYDDQSGITNTEILCIIEGDNGSIYFGSDGGGLYILENGTLRGLGLDDGLKSQVIMKLYKDTQRDVYWIITSNSIAYMKDEKIHTLSNFPYSNNLDMQFDNRGGIWVLSGNGIYFVNGDKLLEDIDLLYSFYNIHSGLPSITTANSRNYLSPDGILYIAGNSGVCSININTAGEGKDDIRLVVPFIEIDGEEGYINAGDTITLPSYCKRITIHGYAMTYQHNPQVSYYLEGFDDTVATVPNHEMKPVSYTNLPGGEYIFHMSIIDIMTGNATNSIAVRIVKEPAFYEQMWFLPLVILLTAALFACAAFGITIWYTNRAVKKKDNEIEYQAALINIFSTYLSRNTDNVFTLMDADAVKLDYISPNVERVLGIPKDAIMSDVRRFGPDYMRGGSGARLGHLLELEPGTEEEDFSLEWVNPQTQERMWLLESVYCTQVQGRRKLVFYISDRTKDRQAQDRLSEALQMAKAANEAKTAFLGSVSHDIRTPMNAIIGFTILMKDEVEDPVAQEYAGRIETASQHLLSLINDVLDINKIESGSTTLNLVDMNLAEVVDEINAIIRPQAQAKEQDFDIFVSPPEHELLQGDKLRINQILINLLSNSVKYTPTGGRIRMRVEELPQAVKKYSRVRFTVSDNGMGMSEEYQKVIFEPFTREETKDNYGIQGTGLGMAITRSLVDLMGGSIKVTSKLGEGSTFTVELSLRIREQEEDGPEFWKDHGVTRMIVTDDDEEVCHGIVKTMSRDGVETDYATDGETAIRMMRSAREAGRPYDVVLLDWEMPRLNGLETARLIRRDYSEKIPILLLTAHDWSEIEDQAAEIGIHHFMSKPFFMSTFKNAIRRIMDAAGSKDEKDASGDVVKGKHVLVVDDIEVNRIILVKILGTLGAVCDTADNGREAVDKFEASQPGDYDLILMDVQMPVLNGYEATRAIRSGDHPAAKTVPIIAMTANAFADDVRDAIESGMDAHIAKPVQIDSLRSTIQKVLDDRAEQSDGPEEAGNE